MTSSFVVTRSSRIRAASDLVDGLPQTIADINALLRQTPHRMSREVQYTVLNCLDFSTISSQHIDRLVPTVEKLLYDLDSDVAFVWMKLGCLLGDGWYRAGTTELRKKIEVLLCDTVRNAPLTYARRGALHGIEHVLNEVQVQRGKRLLQVVQDVAIGDRAKSIRRSAYFILQKGDWWGRGGLPELHRYARKLGRSLQYPESRRNTSFEIPTPFATSRNRHVES